MATVAFIESNTTGTGHVLARKALARGFRVAFLTANPERHAFLAAEMIHPVLVDTEDRQAMLGRLRALPDLRAVLSTSEYYLEPAAHLAAALGLPGAAPEAVEICRDKWRLQERLARHGCATPRTSRIESVAEASECWGRHRPPVVVKPTAGSGSVDVRMHESEESFLSHVGRLLAKTTNERGQPVQPVVLAQDFIAGCEVSVEAITAGGEHRLLGITLKHLGEAPFCLEIGHDFPAPVDPEVGRAVEETTGAALDAVGWSFGPTHTELKVEDGRAVVIEINPRLAGGLIPLLVEHATGLDLLDALLDLHLGQQPDLRPRRDAAASIRFLIPPRAGRLARVCRPEKSPGGVVETLIKKSVGDAVVRQGDFRDRIGHVIAVGDSVEESRRRALGHLDEIRLEVEDTEVGSPTSSLGADTGRLKTVLHSEALAIVRKPPERRRRRQELEWLAAVDEAHLLMLAEEGIVRQEKVRGVLREIVRLRESDFGALTEDVAPRGTYLLYEGELIDRLGVDLAGITHTGRSRNDINACLFRLGLRRPFEAVYRGLWRLRSALIGRASQTLKVAMPVYSQFQPGLPGTLAYYLLSIEEALSRDQEALRHLLPALDTSPLGAGAGGGTPFPIDPERTATLLGFRDVTRSALDAVASRDLALRLLAAAAISGMHVTRLAQDFQLWTTLEFGFVELPDDLSGGSSMMPQKKNPYLLEMIKGRASRLVGAWTSSASTMSKTPFSNAVEVGTEAMSGVTGALCTFEEAAILMALIVNGARIHPEKMERSARRGVVCASLVTDTLVAQEGVAFRAAHHRVGGAIREALERGSSPQEAVSALVSDSSLGDDPLAWSQRYEYGGGPGRATSRAALRAAEERLDADAAWLRNAVEPWRAADGARASAVAAFLAPGAA